VKNTETYFGRVGGMTGRSIKNQKKLGNPTTEGKRGCGRKKKIETHEFQRGRVGRRTYKTKPGEKRGGAASCGCDGMMYLKQGNRDTKEGGN